MDLDRAQLLRELVAERFRPQARGPAPINREPRPARREPVVYRDTDLDRFERRRILNMAMSCAEPVKTSVRRAAGLSPVVPPLRRAS